MDRRIGMDVAELTKSYYKRNTKLALIGDVHIGAISWLNDFTEWMVDYLKRYRIPWIGMGDYLEFATKSSPGKGMYEQTLNPDEQKAEFKSLFRPIRKTCIGLHHGNHDNRSKDSGMTETVNLCEYLDTQFLNSHCYHDIQVREHTWRLLTTHGKSAAKKPETKINSCIGLQEKYTADIFAMGHVHRLENKDVWENKIDIRNGIQRMIRNHIGTYILTGSFLDYLGSYAQDEAYHPEPAGFPIIHFKKDGTFEVEKIYNPEVLIE